MKNKLALGVDIGGTNSAYGIIDENGSVVYETSTKTKQHLTPESLVEHIYKDINRIQLHNQIVGIGVGAPNGNYFSGNIEYAPNLHWKGIIPLANLFEKKFGRKTILTNDANAAAIGEMLFGTAKHLKNFVTITLGTGLGSGIVIDGKIVYGEYGTAGEYGHIRVIPNGRLCGCGRRGCLETYASATGVVRSVVELDSPNKESSILLKNTDQLTSKMVVDAAKNGDLFAIEIVEYTAKILGSALADFTCFSNPNAYVLFGGFANTGSFFAEKVKKYMETETLNIYKDKVAILVSELQNENAAILGNAAIVFQEID